MGNSVLFNVTTLVLYLYNLHYDYAKKKIEKKVYILLCVWEIEKWYEARSIINEDICSRALL